ncbi:hypothetical protein HYX08_06905 [Candidatus Woesearchaeota archaeon]|nr:hypothetical protein [Candidatus Woesearchaeota archaeon]
MLENFLRAYHHAVDSLMLKVGYAPEPEVVRTFGGVPKLGHVSLVRDDLISILNGHKYVWLGPYKAPYEKIQKAKQTGESRVTLIDEDFNGGASLFNFSEIQRLREEARISGRDCLVKDLELVLDYDTLFSIGKAAPENSH